MANWCYQYMEFEGPDTKKVMGLFSRLSAKERKTGYGQTLKKFKDDRYLFNIELEDEGSVRFETKWSPAENTINYIFSNYNITGECGYEESGMGIYGKTIKTTNRLRDVCLTHEDLEQIVYDEDLDLYTFKGEVDETDTDFIEQLLEDKIKHT